MNEAVCLEDAREEDLPAIVQLNRAAIPNVNDVDLEGMRQLLSKAIYFRTARTENELSGFLIGPTPEADYASPNFLWFKARYPRFVYVDRIVVGETARTKRVGSRLYEDIISFAEALAPILTCEVNLRPSNDVSLAFHAKHGFRQVGTQDTESGNKTVALMVRDLGE